MSDAANPNTTPAPAAPPAPPPAKTLPAWASWCKLLEGLRKAHETIETAAVAIILQARLLRFSAHHGPDPVAIKKITAALYRAVPLLQAALNWEEPAVGGKAAKRSETECLRGDQWRLVLAFSGLETLVKSLVGQKGRGGLGADHFRTVLAGCALPEYVPLEVPAHKDQAMEDWFTAEAQDDLLDFLGLDFGDAKITARWLVERRPMGDWVEGLCLAKAIRNATVHGALSASKVKEWKLGRPIRRLVDDIGTVAGAVLDRLVAEEAT